MPHAADEWGPAEYLLGCEDQAGPDGGDEFDDLADLDDLDDPCDFDDIDDFDDTDDIEDPCDSDDAGDPDDAGGLVPPPDEAADERLRQMLERLEAVIPEDAPSLWVRVLRTPTDAGPKEDEADPDAVEIDPDLPGLIGFVAPRDCIAVAIVGVGRAHHYEPAQKAGRNRPAPAPIDVPPGGMSARTICLMDRSGRMVGRTWLEDGTSIPAPPETGRLVDALRRCFGLPTAPPEYSAGELVARLWLANVLAAGEDEAVRQGWKLGWKQVRELHPSAEALRALGVPLTGPTVDRAREVSATAWSWSRLRLQAMEGDWLPALIDPGLAGWMDEGMFSRWVLEGTRSTTELLELVTPWVTPSALMKLAQALQI